MSERDRLLHLVAAHLLDHGVTSSTLRGLARAAGSNNRMLLYYFGSREQLVGEALQAVAREHFPGFEHAWAGLEDGTGPLRQDLQTVWDEIAAPRNLPFLKLFFEVFGQLTRQPGYSELMGDMAAWHRPAATRLRREGLSRAAAEPLAAELVALWRGLQMTLILTQDLRTVERVQRQALDAFCARALAHTAAGAAAGADAGT